MRWRRELCFLCGSCAALCGPGAITVHETFLELDHGRCTGCVKCVEGCPAGALVIVEREGGKRAPAPAGAGKRAGAEVGPRRGRSPARRLASRLLGSGRPDPGGGDAR